MELEYTLSCGCKFKQFGTRLKDIDNLPSIEIDFYNLKNCNSVWPMLKNGKTKGIFQLESELGRSWCEKVEPWNIDDLSALTAIIRPGVLESIVDGKSLTQKFADRHTGREDVIPIHPALEYILQETEQILVYQEQIMRICNEIAGMSLGDSDGVRKAVGKKNAKDLHQYKDMFINGCIQRALVDENTAKLLFDIIEKSGRYSFNACLTPDTVVETNSGHKTIENLEIGEKVNSPYGFVEVVNKFDNGIKEVYEITLADGKTIKCTIDHQFLCENGEILPLYEILDKDLSIIVDSSV